MKIITWEWRKQVMKDYFILPWVQVSQHFKNERHWSYEFHWKGSNAWYCNFRRQKYDSQHKFSNTRLTLRFGKHLIVIGGVNMDRYYNSVKVLEIKDRGIITYKCPVSGHYETPSFAEILKAMKDNYAHLSKDYPDNTWRN